MKTITVTRTYEQVIDVDVSDEEYERVVNKDPAALERIETEAMQAAWDDEVTDLGFIGTVFTDEDGDEIGG